MKILIVASFAASLRNFRGPLILTLLRQGHEVHVAAPGISTDAETRDWLALRRVCWHDIPMERTGLSPAGDLRCLISLVAMMRRIGCDVFLGYTIKPVIWGLFAARLAGVQRRAAMITGLGYAFTGTVTGKRALIQQVVRGLYRMSLRQAGVIFFQNPDDRADFVRMRLLGPSANVRIVNGSGLDLSDWPPQPLPQGPVRFLLIARLLGDKGIREYAAAAAILAARHPAAQFHLIGGLDSNPDAICQAEVDEWTAAGTLVWHGHVADVRSALACCHVYVLPSYREGTPRTVLEAMATGRPVITTNAPGCRETVVDGANGFLVPVKDANALAKVMERFLLEPQLISRLGECSLAMVRQRYDVHKVNADVIEALGLIGTGGSACP